MAQTKVITQKPQDTKELGKLLGLELRAWRPHAASAFIILLKGDLGAGKTVFIKGLALGLGIRSSILSPTFVIAKRYEIKKTNFKNLWHIDCYRITRAAEIKTVGLRDILKDKKNIVAIEWPERISPYLPKKALTVSIAHDTKNTRTIIITDGKKR